MPTRTCPGSKIKSVLSVLEDLQKGGIEKLHLVCEAETRSFKQEEFLEFVATLPDVGGSLEGVRATLCRGKPCADQFLLFLWHESMQALETAQLERQKTEKSNREHFSRLCKSFEVDM